MEAGNFAARLALTEEERVAAYRLRFLVFNLEMNEGELVRRRGDLWNQCGQQVGELFFGAAAYLHDIFVVDGFGGLVSGGDDACS
jgi:hypothetical protein